MILCIETSSLNCSVALVDAGRVIDELEKRESGYTHAESLHVFIDELLKRNKLSPSELHAVAVSAGPGSYTGLRIGVSSAKGLCFALQIPLIAVSTLEMLVGEYEPLSDCVQIIPMIDARRMEVYMQVFDRQRKAVSIMEARVLDETYFENLEEGTVILGEGADKFETLVNDHTLLIRGVYPRALAMAAIAQEKFEQKAFEDLAYFEPNYLKEFMAGPASKSK